LKNGLGGTRQPAWDIARQRALSIFNEQIYRAPASESDADLLDLHPQLRSTRSFTNEAATFAPIGPGSSTPACASMGMDGPPG